MQLRTAPGWLCGAWLHALVQLPRGQHSCVGVSKGWIRDEDQQMVPCCLRVRSAACGRVHPPQCRGSLSHNAFRWRGAC